MFMKVVGSLLLLAFFCVQLSYSLQCYGCSSVSSCRSPGKINCNGNNANETVRLLSQNFQGNFTNVTSSVFNCVTLNYTSPQTNITYKGCVYDRVQVCSLTPKSYNLKKVKCSQGKGNLSNPAATFSSSTFIVFASIIFVTVCKVLNF